METIAIVRVRRDGGTQPRAKINEETVKEYAEEMKRGEKFPPIKVVFDGTDYWPWDGFHRLGAAEANGNSLIAAEVTSGTQRDAILLSLKANCDHGQRRTNDDKRRSVMVCLNDDEWKEKSQAWIADKCSVTQQFVSRVISESGHNSCDLERKVKGKDGKTYTVKPKPEKKTEKPQDGKATKEVVGTATTAGSVAEPEESETQPARSSSDPIKDPRGNPVPENLVDVFSDSVWGEIDATAKKLTSLIDRAASSPGGFYLTKDMENKNGSRRLTSFEAAKNSIFHCKPYGVCPACLGGGCKHCYQKGFLAKLTYKQVEGVVS